MDTQPLPYAIHRSGDWYIVMDTRNNVVASYPTQSKAQARREVDTLNRAYAEAVADVSA